MMAVLMRGKPVTQRYTPTATVNAGDVIVIGNRPFIATVPDPETTLQGTPVVTYPVTSLDVSGGIYRMTADAAYPCGTYVYWNPTAQVVTASGQAGGQCVPFGWIVGGPGDQLSDGGPASGSGYVCSVEHDPTDDTGMIYGLGAAATDTITNTATETAFATTVVIPTGQLVAGDVLHIKATGVVTGQNATNTNDIKLKILTAANTYTTVVNTGAINAAANAVFVIDVDLVFTAVGNTGAFYAVGDLAFGAQGTATRSPTYTANTAINTNLNTGITIEVTDTQSAASTNNVTELLELFVEKKRR